jgi:hypothetical protein
MNISKIEAELAKTESDFRSGRMAAFGYLFIYFFIFF